MQVSQLSTRGYVRYVFVDETAAYELEDITRFAN